MIDDAEVLADPVGVVCRLVSAREISLDTVAIERVVNTVAPGRSTRRRLARALRDRPALLDDGRSPAPRVVATLLVGLIEAGAVNISPPRCTDCAKALRTFHRRGENWYCTVCGPTPLSCAACGKIRRVGARDRQGRPRCHACPPDDGPDPIEIIREVITAVDPGVAPETVSDAVARVTSRAGQRRQLAWAVEDRPELLTGAGAEAGVPSVLRLIDALCEAGATNIVRPACPHCGRVVTLSKIRDGLRLCRGCEARLRAVPCGRCGVASDPVSRDEHGQPLCAHCFITDPINQEICVDCGRRRPVSVRTADGPRCGNCRPLQRATCSICQRLAPCEISKATGEPWCQACQKHWARCTSCDKVRPLRGGSIKEPLCAMCTRSDPSFWRRCPTCDEPAQLRSGPCARCVFEKRLRELLSGAEGEIRPELQSLYDNLAGTEDPDSVLRFITKNDASAVLGELGKGTRPLSHDALDSLGGAKPVEHLRAVLVATGALAPRDEQMARLERWVTATITARSDPEQPQLLQHYGLWHLMRRLRRRNKDVYATYSQTAVVKAHLRVAISLLDWLAARSLTLASCNQGHLDTWIASGSTSRRGGAGYFVRWAAAKKLTSVSLPAVRWIGPSGGIDTDARWEQARWLLRDGTLKTEDRAAGLLVLLYAQTAAAISRLTLDHVDATNGEVRLRLGAEPIVVPEPLASLILDLIASRRGHAAIGELGTSPWLFPGGQPGRPISASRITERLRALGLRAGPARSTALFQLATELPAAVLARMLGIHIKAAVQWQQVSSGDWAPYAAEVSRRHQADRR